MQVLLAGVVSQKYLGHGILSWPIDDVVHRPLPADVVHANELEQAGVDEAHAHAVPHVHGSQIRHDGQRRPETVRRREEVEHRRHTCEHTFVRQLKRERADRSDGTQNRLGG